MGTLLHDLRDFPNFFLQSCVFINEAIETFVEEVKDEVPDSEYGSSITSSIDDTKSGKNPVTEPLPPLRDRTLGGNCFDIENEFLKNNKRYKSNTSLWLFTVSISYIQLTMLDPPLLLFVNKSSKSFCPEY